MSTSSRYIASPSFTYSDGSADADANNAGWVNIHGSTLRVQDHRTPGSSVADGLKGEICHDDNFIYICVADDTWKRVTLATF